MSKNKFSLPDVHGWDCEDYSFSYVCANNMNILTGDDNESPAEVTLHCYDGIAFAPGYDGLVYVFVYDELEEDDLNCYDEPACYSDYMMEGGIFEKTITPEEYYKISGRQFDWDEVKRQTRFEEE